MAQKRFSQLTSFFWHNAAVVGITMSTTLIFAFATLYLREEIGVSNFMVGLAISLSHVISVFLSPIAGTLSDKTRTRWGRRRPYLVGGSLIAGLLVLLMPGIKDYWVFMGLLSVFFVFSVAYQIPFYALIPEVAPEGQRGVYSTFTGLLRLFGAGVLMGAGGWLWARNPGWTFYITAAAIIGTAWITAFSVKSEPEMAMPEEDTINIFRNFRPYMKDLFSQKEIFLFFAAQFFWWMGMGAILPFLTIILKELYKINISELMKTTPLVVTGGAALVAAIIGAGILGDKWGHRKVISAGLGILVVGCLIAFFARSMPFVYLAIFIIGLGVSPIFNEPFALMAEMIPKGREGEFYGLDTISITLSQVPASLIGGAIIDTFGHAAVYLFVAVCALIAMFFMWLKSRLP
jgi:MFS family permease